MIKRWHYIVVCIGLFVSVLPMMSVIVSSAVASAFGCTLHEGFANTCVVFGADIGETLATMFAAGWVMLVTLPVTLVCLSLLVVLTLIRIIQRRRG